MRMIKLAGLVTTLVAAPVWADCERPDKPELPDGANASMEEMLAGQKAVKSFQEDNMDYMKCMEGRIASAREAGEAAETEEAATAAAETYTNAVEAYNAAVSAEESVAGEFNTQVREYRAANSD